MATNYKIAAEFSVVDRGATAALNNMAGRAGVFSSMWNKSINAAQTRLEALGKTVSKASKYAVGGAVGAVSAGIVVATKQYAEFEQAIRAAGASYGPAFTQAADFEQKLDGMGKAVRKVAAATEFNAVESANAMRTLARAGVSAEAAVKLLPGVADLATTAMVSMDEAVEMANNSLGVLGMRSDDPAKYAANLTRLSDVMAHTANSASMSVADVAAAIVEAGSNFRSARNNIDVLSGSLTALAQNGIAGQKAGVAMRNIFIALTPRSKNAADAMNRLGIKTKDAQGNFLALPAIIGQFNKSLAKMGNADRNDILGTIFGKESLAAVNALLNTGQGALEEFARKSSESMGTAAKAAEAMRGGLLNQFQVLGSALMELGFNFVEAFKGKGSEALKNLTIAISQFDPKPLVNALVHVVDVVIGAAKFLWEFRYVIALVAGAFAMWKAIATAVAVIRTLRNAIQIATAVQWAWNAALNANPIGAVIIAAVALTAVIAALVKNWNGITSAVEGFFRKVREMKGVGGAILKFICAPIEMAWNRARAFLDVINAFVHGGFIAGLRMIAVAVLQFLIAPIEALLQMLSVIPGVGDLFGRWNDEMHGWLEGWRADILGNDESSAEEEEAPGSDLSMTPPTLPELAAQQAAENLSREESVTTNRLEVSLAPELAVKPVAHFAPAFTLYSGRR